MSNSHVGSIAPSTNSYSAGSPMSEERIYPHFITPSTLDLFPANWSPPESTSVSIETLPQLTAPSIARLFPPAKSSSVSDETFSQFSHSITSLFPPAKSQTSSWENDNKIPNGPTHSIDSIFPPARSDSDSLVGDNDDIVHKYSKSLSIQSCFHPVRSSSESDQPNLFDDATSSKTRARESSSSHNNKEMQSSYMGTITGISDLDPVRWQISHGLSVNPPTGTFVKVHKSGSFRRPLDISKFSGYDELRCELARMFGLEGQLEAQPRSGWQIVFVDWENDVLLLGDHPWQEFVNIAWYIRILSPHEVQQMGKEVINPATSAPSNGFASIGSLDY